MVHGQRERIELYSRHTKLTYCADPYWNRFQLLTNSLNVWGLTFEHFLVSTPIWQGITAADHVGCFVLSPLICGFRSGLTERALFSSHNVLHHEVFYAIHRLFTHCGSPQISFQLRRLTYFHCYCQEYLELLCNGLSGS